MCVGITHKWWVSPISRATKIVFSSKLVNNEKIIPVLQALDEYLRFDCKGLYHIKEKEFSTVAEQVGKEKSSWAQIQVNQFNIVIWRRQQPSGWKALLAEAVTGKG